MDLFHITRMWPATVCKHLKDRSTRQEADNKSQQHFLCIDTQQWVFFVAAQQLNPVRQYCTRPRMPPRMFEDLYDGQAFIMETAARASTKVLPTTVAIAWRLSSPNNHYNNSSIYLVESDCIECGLRGFFCTFRPRLRESFANYICCEYSVQAAFPWTE